MSADQPHLGDPTVLFEGKYLRALAHGHWEFVTRKNASGVVIIVAVTPNGDMLFVEQFRPPVGRRVIELPAGLAGDHADKADEPLSHAAIRELEEETGWRAARMEQLAEGPVSAGLTDETVTFFRAHDLASIGPGGGDAFESIVVHQVPVADVPKWLTERQQAGALVDPKVFAALYFIRAAACAA